MSILVFVLSSTAKHRPSDRPSAFSNCVLLARMPRILPRLIKGLVNPRYAKEPRHVFKKKSRSKSLWKPPIEVKNNPYSATGWNRPILLENFDFVSRHKTHKRMPPVLKLHRNQLVGKSPHEDVPRKMTRQEKTWWSDPYRMCQKIYTENYLISGAQ